LEQTGRIPSGSLQPHEISAAPDRLGAIVDAPGSVYSRRLHQRTLAQAAAPGTASDLERGADVATAPADGAHAHPFFQPVGGPFTRAARLAPVRSVGPSAWRTGCAHAPRISRASGGERSARHQRYHPVALDRTGGRLVPCRGPHRRHGLAGGLLRLQKKDTGRYTAGHAALGGRTLKTGQSQCFVGYKKHTFRLWWREHTAAVLLVPLVSWGAPANVSEGGFLVPSLRYCERRWSWWPPIVVADMGYLAAEAKAFVGKIGGWRW
jgi:hypothetical protein